MSGKIENLKKQAQLEEDESSLSSAEKTLESKAEAERFFSVVKSKLLNIGEWNDHGLISSYELFNEDGQTLESSSLAVGVFIRILLKGSGKYDWVRLIDIYDAEGEFVITVKPTFDPTEENPDRSVISHFFTDESTNNFCLSKNDETVSLYVIGLAEKQNTSETDGALQTVRNVAVNLGSYLGIQNSEWEKFCSGFLECAMNEMRRQSETSKV